MRSYFGPIAIDFVSNTPRAYRESEVCVFVMVSFNSFGFVKQFTVDCSIWILSTSAPTMATSRSDAPLWLWLLSTGISFLCCIIGGCILHRERQKRQQPDHITVSKHLSASSYLCIALGPINSFSRIISYLPGLCYVYDILGGPLGILQNSAMEYYQLSRLYYCFSRKQIHSKVGYRNWVFVVLFCLMVIWYISMTIVEFAELTTECQIARGGIATVEDTELFLYDPRIWILIPTILFVIEFTTAALYWYKIHSLQRYRNDKDRAVYDRIQSILHRVLILTFLYLIALLMAAVVMALSEATAVLSKNNPIIRWTYSLNDLIFSYSMFLMQDHNTSEYIAFLRFIKRYKCIWCFCCFASMVREQNRMLVDNVEQRTFEQEKSTQSGTNTHNISVDLDYGNNTTGMEFSIATQTVCELPCAVGVKQESDKVGED